MIKYRQLCKAKRKIKCRNPQYYGLTIICVIINSNLNNFIQTLELTGSNQLITYLLFINITIFNSTFLSETSARFEREDIIDPHKRVTRTTRECLLSLEHKSFV